MNYSYLSGALRENSVSANTAGLKTLNVLSMEELDSLLDEYKEIEQNIKNLSEIQGNCAKDPLVYFTLSTMTKLPNQSTTGREVNYSVSSVNMRMDGISAIRCLNVIMNKQMESLDEVVRKLNKLRNENRSSNTNSI